MRTAETSVAYYFAFLPKRPRCVEDLNACANLKMQKLSCLRFCRRHGTEIAKEFVGWSTSRQTSFARSPVFSGAIRFAAAANSGIVLCDIQELLRSTPQKYLLDCFELLNNCNVQFTDVKSGETWQSLSIEDRRSMLLAAAKVQASRSDAIKRGLSLRNHDRRQGGSDEGRLRGAHTNRVNADQHAENLRNFVDSERAKRGCGEELRIADVQRALNEAGHRTPRGNTFSYNATKNLLMRLSSPPDVAPPH